MCNEKDNANRKRLREETQRPKGELSSVSTLVAALTFAIDQKFGPTKPTGEDSPDMLSSALVTVRKLEYATKFKRAGKAQIMEKHERVLGQKRAAEDELKSAQKLAKRTQAECSADRRKIGPI